jgi:hypothetical protein
MRVGLATISRRAPQFEGFVLRHLDETVPADVGRIAKNAHTACRPRERRLCKLIERKVR